MSRRTQKVNDLLRQEISDLLLRHVNDPRLNAFLSITEVEVSADLKHAQVFVSIMGDSETKADVLRGLRSASGFLRRELAHRLTMRFVPELAFHQDDSIERGSRVLEILQHLSEDSKEVKQE